MRKNISAAALAFAMTLAVPTFAADGQGVWTEGANGWSKEAFTGKRKPLAGYDSSTNSIIVVMGAPSRSGHPPLNLKLYKGDLPSPYRDLAK